MRTHATFRGVVRVSGDRGGVNLLFIGSDAPPSMEEGRYTMNCVSFYVVGKEKIVSPSHLWLRGACPSHQGHVGRAPFIPVRPPESYYIQKGIFIQRRAEMH
ncbi:hypothetical protein DdX_11364 [Ditylenchus destructor]|uniref:Uncharacterized protein n=1 Tax=Ditylenchus destructor TaxID=166010 RepID=A0AAD4MZF2_9BILA|nr:hypothetical protein DdX_11364 [Ditylenchus destructor]